MNDKQEQLIRQLAMLESVMLEGKIRAEQGCVASEALLVFKSGLDRIDIIRKLVLVLKC